MPYGALSAKNKGRIHVTYRPEVRPIRFNSKIKSFYQRKKAKTKAVVAIKAVAHKLCRACYHIIERSSRL